MKMVISFFLFFDIDKVEKILVKSVCIGEGLKVFTKVFTKSTHKILFYDHALVNPPLNLYMVFLLQTTHKARRVVVLPL